MLGDGKYNACPAPIMSCSIVAMVGLVFLDLWVTVPWSTRRSGVIHGIRERYRSTSDGMGVRPMSAAAEPSAGSADDGRKA